MAAAGNRDAHMQIFTILLGFLLTTIHFQFSIGIPYGIDHQNSFIGCFEFFNEFSTRIFDHPGMPGMSIPLIHIMIHIMI